MTCYRNCIKCMLLLFFMGLAALNTYSHWKTSHSFNTQKTSIPPIVTLAQSSTTPFHCPFESWNQVHSDSVPNENLHLEWIQNNISRRDNILESQIQLQKVYCRYYNCAVKRSPTPPPIHEVSVCVGPIYGSESKWLEVAEFIEHYKLIGVRYFYLTVFNMNEYSRKIIDEYLRTGEIELTVIQSEYKTIDWQFHLLQINIIFEMEFLKYNVSSPVTWGAYRTIYRPEKVQLHNEENKQINNQ
ncbi:hypothetical protein CRE_19607, partial [Caenorhabditis remanei]